MGGHDSEYWFYFLLVDAVYVVFPLFIVCYVYDVLTRSWTSLRLYVVFGREEVRKHAVRWNAEFSFVCKMCANANTGVLEPALMRVSVRKECKGNWLYRAVHNRSNTRLGAVCNGGAAVNQWWPTGLCLGIFSRPLVVSSCSLLRQLELFLICVW